jgi:hypothetical protein
MATRTDTLNVPAETLATNRLRGRQTPLFARIQVDILAVLVDLTNGNAIHGRVENLSVGGMFFRGTDSLDVGTRVLCTLIRTDGEYQDELYTNGTVVHRHSHGVGVAFDEVTPRAFAAISDIIATGLRSRSHNHEPCWPVASECRGERPRRHARNARMTKWHVAIRAA